MNIEFLEWLLNATYPELIDAAYLETYRCEVCGISRMVRGDGHPVFGQSYEYRHHKDCPVLISDALSTSTRYR